MNRNEFKRAWREFRTEIRNKQAAFGPLDHDGMTRDLDAVGRYLCAGFTKTGRSIEACRLQNRGKGIADLVDPRRSKHNPHYRREAIRLSRLYGPISFGRAA